MIISHEEVADIALAGNEIAVKVGCFDLFHEGHQSGLDFASQQADILVVGVLTDEYVRRRKGPERPIQTWGVRAENVDTYDVVDFVTPIHGLSDVVSVLRKARPSLLVDFKEHTLREAGARVLLPLLGVGYVIDRTERLTSTTSIIARNTLKQEG